jgi:hypothetical protein
MWRFGNVPAPGGFPGRIGPFVTPSGWISGFPGGTEGKGNAE